MKLSIFCLTLALSSFSYAQSIGETYQDVNSVSCVGENGNLNLDIDARTLSGTLTDGDEDIEFSYEILAQDPEAAEGLEFGLIINFLESGIDLMGGPVVDSELTTFGYYAVALEKELGVGDDVYSIVYVEAMTGAQIIVPMNCTFE